MSLGFRTITATTLRAHLGRTQAWAAFLLALAVVTSTACTDNQGVIVQGQSAAANLSDIKNGALAITADFKIAPGTGFVNSRRLDIKLDRPLNIKQYRAITLPVGSVCRDAPWGEWGRLGDGGSITLETQMPEGEILVCVDARVSATTPMASAEAKIVFDASPPLLTMEEPPAVIGVASTSGAQTIFRGTVSDVRPGLKEVSLILKNRTSGKYLSSTTGAFSADEETIVTPELSGEAWELKIADASFTEGDYELRARARDLAGNVSKAPAASTNSDTDTAYRFHWDQRAPNAAFTVAGGKTATRERQLIATLKETSEDTAAYKLSVGGSCQDVAWLPFTQTNGAIPLTLPDADSTYDICITLVDSSGNISRTETQTVTLDRVVPTISVASLTTISPADSIDNRVQIRGSVFDNLSGIAFVRVSVRHADDYCLNAAGTAFDATCPTWHLASTTSNWLVSVSHEPFLYTDGIYSVTAEAEDLAGNVTPVPALSPFNWRASLADIVIASAPASPSNALTPVITVTGTNAQSYKTKVVQGGSTNCGLQGYGSEVPFSQPTTLNVSSQPDGQLTVCAVGRDFNGFWQLFPVTASWIKDTVAPTITISPLIRTKQPIEFSATSSKPGTYLWSKSSGSGNLTFGSPNSLSTWVTASQDGSYQVNFRATDLASNIATTETTLIWDTTAPSPGANGQLNFADISFKTLTLSWTAATDALTTSANIRYQVYMSRDGLINDLDTVTSLGTPVGSSLTGTTSLALSNLSPGTPYYFNVVAIDELGHKALYQMANVTTMTDTTPPVVGSGGLLTVASYTDTSVNLNWTTATDDQTAANNLKYFIYQSPISNIDTLANIAANGGIPINGIFGSQNIGTFLVSGLTPSTRYYFAVISEDEAGNRALYMNANQKTRVGPVVAATSTLTVVGGTSSVASGSTVTLVLQARDVTGAPLATGGATVTLIRGGTGSSFYEDFPLAAFDVGNGTYRFTLTGKLAGSATELSAAINGNPVTNTVSLNVVPGAISGSSSILAVVGGAGTVASGSTATIKLTAFDYAGNRIHVGGAQVSFNVASGNSTFAETLPINAADRQDGTYEAVLTGLLADTPAILTTSINSAPANATTSLEVVPGPISVSRSLVSLPATITPGANATLVFSAKDTAGNNLRTGGESVEFIKVGGSGTFTEVAPLLANDQSNGTYTAQVTGALAGPITIAGKIGSGTTQSTASSTVVANVVATATGQPTGSSLLTSQHIIVGGNGLVKYKYKIGMAASTDCSVTSGYSTEKSLSTAITDDIVAYPDGAVKLCILGADFAHNWQDPASATVVTWNKIRVPPSFTSLALINDAADNYINQAESALANDIGGSLSASTYDTAAYALAPVATSCNDSLTYGSMPKSSTLQNSPDGLYQICIKLLNTSNPPVYAASQPFTLKKALPDFTSAALKEEASDGFINLAERSSQNSLVDTPLGASFDTAAYKLVTSNTTCDGQITYGSAPRGDSPDFTIDGSYKICVRLTDIADNPADYGETFPIIMKTTHPTFISLPLANEATDTYINAADHTANSTLVADALGTNFDSALYKLVSASQNCANSTNYGSKPLAAATEFSSDGLYKVCTKLSDNAGNPAVYGSSQNINLKLAAPSFTSLALSGPAADGYISGADHSLTSILAGNLVATNYDFASYKLVEANSTCDGTLSYGSMPQANASEFVNDGAYKICIKLDDNAQNPSVFAAGPTIQLKLNGPSFTSIDLSTALSDGYLNYAENQSSTPLVNNLQGSLFDSVGYAVVTDLTACDNTLTYGAVPTQNSVEFAADGTYKVCIKLTDFAANSPVFGHSASFDLKRAAPTFTSLDLVGDVVDGYVSSFDRQAAQPIAGNLDALNYDSVGYKLVTDSTPCDQSLTYGAMPTAGSADFGSDGNYKICVRLNDVAGNPSEFGSSPTFALKTSNPSFASINLLNAAQDSYLNAAERALSTPIVDEAQGSLFDHAAYKVVASNITCDASLIYGSIPTANSADITTDGSYKVCVKLTDIANNSPDFDQSPTFAVKISQPTFTSLGLAGDIIDTYLNATERTSNLEIVSNTVGSHFDSAGYKVVVASQTCDQNLTYGPIPKSDDTAFTVDGTYKVCTRLLDNAGNPPSYGASDLFTLKTAMPHFTSLALVGSAQDGYVNLAESLLTNALVDQAVGLNFDQATYALVTDGTSCSSGSVTYGTIPTSSSNDFVADETYKVCTKLTDAAGNSPTYGSSSPIQLKRSGPTFTSVALINDAADSYITASERQTNNPLVGNLTATAFDTAEYYLVASNFGCDNSLTYGPIPRSNSSDFGGDGEYKVCVKLTDLASNPPTFGSSSPFQLKSTTPQFLSIQLAAEANDGYFSSTDRQSTSPVVTGLSGLRYDTASYKLVPDSISCDNTLAYGPVPLGTSADFGADGTYKICVKLSDNGGNPPDFGASPTFLLKAAMPQFTSIALANDAQDTYINAAERSSSSLMTGLIVGTDYDLVEYRVVPNSTNCDGNITYGNPPSANTPDFGADGQYKICVKITDYAGNPAAFGASTPITLKTALPTFTSIALDGDASDRYLNLAERTNTTPLVGGAVGSGFDHSEYALTVESEPCNTVTSYSSMPLSNSQSFDADGNYKVCVKLTDLALNPPAFGSSLSITLKEAQPNFTSLPLANTAANLYVNAAEKTENSDLGGQVQGAAYDSVAYKLVPESVSCESVPSYGSMPKANSTDFGQDGSYKICAKLTDLAGNPADYGESAAFSLKTALPTFTSLALGTAAADGYINAQEHTATTDLVTNLNATNYDTATYKLVSAATQCDGSLSYGPLPKVNSTDFGTDGPYHVCVNLTDQAGNPTVYGTSPSFVLKTALPHFTSLNLDGAATDTYINATESLLTSDIIGAATGVNFDTVTYKLVTASTNCDGNLSYGSTPKANSAEFTNDTDYKVCAKLSDAAGNPSDYGPSPVIHLKKAIPSFASLDLVNSATDRYVNAAEHQLTTDLAGNLNGNQYDTADFVLVSGATNCDGNLAYGSMPTASSTSLGSDGLYKVCARLRDHAQNPPSYGETLTFNLKLTLPTFSTLALANEAQDTYINAADRATNHPVTSTATGSNFDTATYKIVTSTTPCDENLSYGALPSNTSPDFGADGPYKICAKLTDNADNPPIFGESIVINLKVTPPAFVSLDLAGAAADGYLNAAETQLTSDLASNLNGAQYSHAQYKLVPSTTTCDGNISYGPMPLANSGDFAGDGIYKVCVRLTDLAANNPAYGATTNFTLKTVLPTFTSVALTGAATDSYINQAERSLSTAIINSLSALNFDDAKYALVSSSTNCDHSLTYGDLPSADSISFTSDGDYRVCVRVTDLASNPADYGSSALIHLKTSQPQFTGLVLAGTAANGYVNAAERLLATDLAGPVTGANFDFDQYKLVPASTTCDSSLTYGPMPKANSTDFVTDGNYKVCVKLSDQANNPTVYESSPPFVLKTAAPTFTSIDLINAASDAYISVTDNASNLPIAGNLIGSNFDTSEYKLVPSNTSCNGPLTYGQIPNANSTDFTTDGSYKVCVRLTDTAGNPAAYGNSVAMTLKIGQPTFTSLALTVDAADTYINAAEKSLSNPIVSSVSGLSFDNAAYKLVSHLVDCDDTLTYGSIPTNNSSDFGSDGDYKVCVKLTDTAMNPPAFGASPIIHLKTSQISFTSIDLINAAANQYINLAERQNSLPMAGNLIAANHDSVAYKLVSSATTCDSSLNYGSVPSSDSTDFTTDGLYKICIKLTDTAMNPEVYNATANLTLKTSAPTFISLPLANQAADSYINAADKLLPNALTGALVGSGYDQSDFKLVLATTACDSNLAYGSSPLNTSTDFTGDGDYKVCARLGDNALNPTAYGASPTFKLKTAVPSFTSLALTGNAADLYINASEKTQAIALGGTLTAANYDSASYRLVPETTNCNGALTFGSMPLSNSTNFATDGRYKICVKLTDLASNPTVYNASPSFTLKTALPEVYGIALANVAVDGYINYTERSSAVAIADTINGAHYDTATYKIVENFVDCDATLTYGSMPLATSTDFTTDGDYKICVKVADNAGNPAAYASSDNIGLKTSYPVFTSLALSGIASDRFINASERLQATSMVGLLSATYYDSVQYKLVASGTNCDNSLTYGDAPLGTATEFTSDGSYKICAKLMDDAGNPPAYGETQSITLKTVAPAFTSLALANGATDLYINLAEKSAATSLASAAVGTNFTTASYRLVTSGTTCNSSLTYGSIPLSNNSILNTDGTYKICVRLVDSAGNTPAFGESSVFTVKTTLPTFTSLALAGDAADSYINLAERGNATALAGSLIATNHSSAQYALTESTTACNDSLTYASMPLSNSQSFTTDGSYKVCVKLTDAAGNTPAYGFTVNFTLKASQPAFTSIALSGTAVDGYVNAADRSSTLDLAGGLVASNQDLAVYKLVSSVTACDANLTYGPVPNGSSTDFGSDGSYKICVKLTDYALNPPAYGESSAFTLKTSAPTLSSLALAGSASDGYINATEKQGSLALVSPASGTGFDSATYKLTQSTTSCDGNLSYGPIPTASSADFGADGTYKVCVKLDDAATNPSVYGESNLVTLKTSLPTFTSVSLANGASDGYVNAAEKSANTPLVSDATVANANSTTYSLVTDTTSCDGNLSYSSLPSSNSADFSTDGLYKVCIKVTDDAGNSPGFGSSATITLKITQPSFSFLAVAGDAADGYINAADRTQNNALAASLSAASYNQHQYKLALSSVSCSSLSGYGSMPTGTSPDFGSDGIYKVCVKLTDDAANPPVYGASGSFNLKTSQPGFLSLSLAGEATDGYISSSERALTTDLAASIAGVNYDQVTYKLVANSVACDGFLTYGAMPKASSGDFGNDGSYKVCARLVDNANNTPAYGASPTFNLRTTSPTVISLGLSGAASDGYINASEHTLSTSIVGTLLASNYDAHTYALVSATTTCDGQLSYGAAPAANAQEFTSDGDYKVCVKVTDNAQNPAGYGQSSNFTFKVNGPSFTSINLANNATDGYINLAETSQDQTLVSGLSATGYNTVEYKLVLATTTCSDAAILYSASAPKSSSTDFTSDGSYKVCIKLTDTAGNQAVYNQSANITLDKSLPVFSSLALDGSASDGYINAAEKLLTTALVGDAQGSSFDTAEYKMVPKLTTCTGSLSYSNSKPQGNSVDFGADGDYKVCVKLSDSAGNPPTYGNSSDIRLVTTQPVFYSVSLAAGDAADYFINAAERFNSADLVGSLVAENHDSDSYKLVPDSTTCDGSLSYGLIPKSSTNDIASDGDYKVCVKVEDIAGNPPAYGESDAFSVKTSTPTFNTITLRNAAADQAVNLAERSLTTSLAGSLSALYYDSVGYKLVTSGTSCSSVTTYGSSIPAANSGDFGADGSYKICVKLTDLAGNPGTYGESNYFALKTTTPIFTSLDLTSVVTDDGYLNADDKAQDTALILVATLVGADYNTPSYKVTTASTQCNSTLTYSTTIPKTTNTALSSDGTYKVCVKLADTAGNTPAYGATNQFTLKTSLPSLSSLPLANENADGYINANDYSLGNTIVGSAIGSNYDSAQYKIVSSTSTCTTSTVYNVGIPVSNSADLTTDRDYKVCVILTDNANNTPQIGYSSNFSLKRNAPVFTSISLANDAVGGYINASERSNANNLANNLSAAGYNSARYAATIFTNSCNGPLNYDTAMPKSNGSAISTDDTYKICVELTDNAGNAAVYGSSSNFTVDSVAPAVTLSSTSGANTKTSPIPVTAAFTEAVTGFTSSDVTVSNGTLANFSGSGSSYTFDISPSANGTVTVSVASSVASDLAGNGNTAATNLTRNYDTVTPTVSSVSTTSASGNYGLGSTIGITVTFSEAVNVTGTPTLTLNTTPTSRIASYSSGNGTTTLTFNYTVQAGDTSGRLDFTATSALSGTIADLAGNAATLTLPGTGSNGLYATNIVVESNLPSPTSVVALQPNGAYGTGRVVDIVVNYSDVMTVSGTPLLALNTSPAQSATYSSGSGGNKLTFQYTVQSGDTVGLLNYSSTSALTLNGGSITDPHGTNASLTLPSISGGNSLADLSLITVDTTAATISNVTSSLANATYGLGKAVPITVNFSETVYVTGQPRLQLNVTPSTRYAVYTSGSGTSALTFTYLVEGPNSASGDQASDLNYASNSALTLNSGSLQDEAGNAATLTLPDPSAAGSLGTNKNIVIDSAVATALAIEARTCCSASRVYGKANELTITFPASVANFNSVRIYSAVGSTPPANCTGTEILTIDPSLVVTSTAVTVLDQTGSAGQTYSYRVCAFNNGNNQMGTATSGSATTSTAQFAFVTNSTTTGNLGGVTAANSTCQTEGANFDSALTWVALLSDSTKEAAGRAPIIGPVYSTEATPALIASDYRDLWHEGTLSQAISYDASGNTQSGSAWTGSLATGLRSSTDHCSNWGSASSALNGASGTVAASNSGWANSGNSSCDSIQRFYCVSQSMQPLTSFSVSTPGTGSGGDVSVSVTFPVNTTNWTKAEVRRMLGNTAPTCSQGTVVRTYNGSTTPFTSETFTDATGKPGALYQYSACVYNGLRLAATYTRTGPAVRTYTATPAHIMFVTNTSYTGDPGSPSAADTLCQTEGDLLISGYTWNAVLGDDNSSAASRINFINSGSDVRNLNGDLVISGSTGLFAAGNLTNAVSYDNTFAQTTARVWTGSATDGSNSSNHCSQWSSSSSSVAGTYGSAGSLITTWLSNSTQTCDKQARLYCVSTTGD